MKGGMFASARLNMSRSTVLIGVIVLAAAFAGLAHVARCLETPNEPPRPKKRVTTVAIHGPVGNASLEDCIAEAVEVVNASGRVCTFTYLHPHRRVIINVTPGDSAEA